MGDEEEKAKELFDKLEDEREQDCEGTALNRHALVTIIATALRQVGREMRECIQESDEAYYAVGAFNDALREELERLQDCKESERVADLRFYEIKNLKADLARFRGLFGDHDEPPRTYEQSEAMWNAMKTELEQVKRERDALTQQLAARNQQHDDLVLRNKLLRDRTDLPIERLQAYDEVMAKLAACEARVTELEGALRAITLRGPIMGSKEDYRRGQLDALNSCSDIARRALDKGGA